MLFATQNPAGAYGGRKPLSRAFRSRFLELQVADIPDSELAEILTIRCSMAPSRAQSLVAAMHELQRRRQVSVSSEFFFVWTGTLVRKSVINRVVVQTWKGSCCHFSDRCPRCLLQRMPRSLHPETAGMQKSNGLVLRLDPRI
jgi:hypothetical protein